VTAVVLVLVVAAGYLWYSTTIVCACYNPTSPRTTTLTNGTNEYVLPLANGDYSISTKVGGIFIIQLSTNGGSTGYSLNITSSSGISYLNSTLVSSSTEPGAPVTYNYFFKATQPGSQSIALVYERTFSGQIGDTIDVSVSVS
jgi:predicted secreted protein